MVEVFKMKGVYSEYEGKLWRYWKGNVNDKNKGSN